NLYNTAYPDATMKGVLSGAALLSNQDISARPVSSIALNIAGVPITRNRVYTDVNGFHIVSWPGNILTNETGTVLFALELDQNNTLGSTVFTLYSVNPATGAMTTVPGATGPLPAGDVMNGSGFVSGTSNIYIPGSTGGIIGYWDMNFVALSLTFRPTTTPAGLFRFNSDVLRSDGTATGLVHWFDGDYFTSQFAAVSQDSVTGATAVREKYAFGLGFDITPVGTDPTLGWLVFDPTNSDLMRVVPGVLPTSAKVYFAPLLTGGGVGGFGHLVGGNFADSSNMPVVHFYPLPALASFPAPGVVDVLP
ncbi:MAG: hypothetical protein Q9M17_05205, partial [Mariprofundus sp.]|nr:hypothetical protein [Mariprofundus sp.]